MTNVKFFVNLIALLIIQLAILDNIQLHSYVYINIYILAIYILPYRLSKASILLFGFFLGLFIDLANNTMGIHAAASTLIAYIRPRLLMLTGNRSTTSRENRTSVILPGFLNMLSFRPPYSMWH